MTTFSTGGSAVTFTTSGSAVSFAVTAASNAFTTSAVLTPGAHASTHGAGGADPITTLGAVAHSGQQTFAAGSAAGPSIAATGDTDTGIYFPAANQVGIATAGTAALTISATQTATFGSAVYGPLGAVGVPTYSFTGDTNTGIYSSAADTVNIAAGGTAVFQITSAGLITGTGTSLGAWTSYTPALGGTGWAIGDGTVTGRYCQIGKVVYFSAVVTFGSTSTYGGSALTISLPVNRVAAPGATAVMGRMTDASTAKAYRCFGHLVSGATTVTPQTIIASTAGEQSDTISTVPFTWQSGDAIFITGTYEAA